MKDWQDIYLRLISAKIDCNQWRRLARHLGISETDLKNSYTGNKNYPLRQMYCHILRKWRDDYKLSTPGQLLLGALQAIGNADLADEIKSIIDTGKTLRQVFKTFYKEIQIAPPSWLTVDFHPLSKEPYPVDLYECFYGRSGKETRKCITIQELFQPKNHSKLINFKWFNTKSEEQDNIPRRIHVEGKRNCGKTTLAFKIAYDWSTEKKYMSDFDLVCVFPLNYYFLGFEHSLWKISNLHDLNLDDIVKFLEENQERVLFIMDDVELLMTEQEGRNCCPWWQCSKFPKVTVITMCQAIHAEYMNEISNGFALYNGLKWDKIIFLEGVSYKKRNKFLSMHFEDPLDIINIRLPKIYDDISAFLDCPLFLLLVRTFLESHVQETTFQTLTEFYKGLCNFILKRGLNIEESIDAFVEGTEWPPNYARELQTISKQEFENFKKKKNWFTTEETVCDENLFAVGFHTKMVNLPNMESVPHYKIIHESINEFMTAYYIWRCLYQSNEEIVEFLIRNIKTWKKEKELLLQFLIGLSGGIGGLLELLSPFAFRLNLNYNSNVLFLYIILHETSLERSVLQAALDYLPPLWVIDGAILKSKFCHTLQHSLLLSHGTENCRVTTLVWNLKHPIVLPSNFFVPTLILELGKFIDCGAQIISHRYIECKSLICKFKNDFLLSNWNDITCLISNIKTRKISLHFNDKCCSQLLFALHQELLCGNWIKHRIHSLCCTMFLFTDSKLIELLIELVQLGKIEEELTLNFLRVSSAETLNIIPSPLLNRLFATIGSSDSLQEFYISNWSDSRNVEIVMNDICPSRRKWKYFGVYGNVKLISEDLDYLFKIDTLEIDDWFSNSIQNINFVKGCKDLKTITCMSDFFIYAISKASEEWFGYQSIKHIKLNFLTHQSEIFHLARLTKFYNLRSLHLFADADVRFPIKLSETIVNVLFQCPLKELVIKTANRENCFFMRKVAKSFSERLLKTTKRRASLLCSSSSASSDEYETNRLPQLHCFQVGFRDVNVDELKKLLLEVKTIFIHKGLVKFSICESKEEWNLLLSKIFHPRDEFNIFHEGEGRCYSYLTEKHIDISVSDKVSVAYRSRNTDENHVSI